ncbi:hypothetical protein AB0M29_33180 [Streptomyces sp. NPDC051976]|uniref:hypothetical protein n=1 Tax=Streptomyces sp. NPDC051976 TaxID=3154947 RepID=UPI00343A7A52
MGYSVLYIAFGIVALWLLGEVLLQYKARLRWRLLAFAGFLGVVGGVYLREVIVIVLGAIAFGAGQSFVTLSYKRGFSTGWALGGRPGSSRRRRGGAPRTEPLLEVSPVEADPAGAQRQEYAAAAQDMLDADEPDVFGTRHSPDSPPLYQPQPLHDDSGEYPLYTGQSSYTPDPYTSGGYEGYGAHGYAGWGGEAQPAAASASYETDGGYDQSGGWGGAQGYGFDAPTPGYQEPAGGQHSAYGWPPPPPETPPYGQPPADPYGYGYPQEPQAQPYIPQQQYQSPYEQQPQQQGAQQGQQQPQYAEHGEYAEYADPYDPYRY